MPQKFLVTHLGNVVLRYNYLGFAAGGFLPSSMMKITTSNFTMWAILGGGFKYVFFHPENWGRWTHFDNHIFQIGWNHQLELEYVLFVTTSILSKSLI